MVFNNQIKLKWKDNAADETAYHIERSPNGITNWIEIVALQANVTEYYDVGLVCSTEYHYMVRAYRESDGQYSQYSNSVKMMTDQCSFSFYLPLTMQSTR
jgi:fibronectin type 3 domain-containing protein